MAQIYIDYRPKEEYFAVKIHGDEMRDAGISDGCVMVFHKQADAANGDIIIAFLNGTQIVRKLQRAQKNTFLMPCNNAYLPTPVTDADDLLILGKGVEVRRTF